MTPTIIILDERDSVGVALRPLKAGDRCAAHDGDQDLRAREDIPFGHKVALVDLPRNAPVRKYGEIIGYAEGEIRAGCHVHTHNLRAPLG